MHYEASNRALVATNFTGTDGFNLLGLGLPPEKRVEDQAGIPLPLLGAGGLNLPYIGLHSPNCIYQQCHPLPSFLVSASQGCLREAVLLLDE